MTTSSCSNSKKLLLNFIENYRELTILLNTERANKEMERTNSLPVSCCSHMTLVQRKPLHTSTALHCGAKVWFTLAT